PRRSSVAAILSQAGKDLVQLRHGLPRHDRLTDQRWCNPTLSDGIGEHGIRDRLGTAALRLRDLGHHVISVRHQDGLSLGCETDVLAQFIFEELDPDGTHALKVALGSYLVNVRALGT
ncbi:MAG: hypothetical protein ABI779_22785, partial [Acidobacteriota bacterium]